MAVLWVVFAVRCCDLDLMPDHVHLIVVPESEVGLRRLIGLRRDRDGYSGAKVGVQPQQRPK